MGFWLRRSARRSDTRRRRWEDGGAAVSMTEGHFTGLTLFRYAAPGYRVWRGLLRGTSAARGSARARRMGISGKRVCAFDAFER